MKIRILFLAAFLGLILAGCGQKTLDLNDYLKTEVSGYNGSGYVSCDVDYESLAKDYAAASGIKRDSDEYLIMEASLEMYIEANCDSDSLSNGDKYTVKWTIPADLAEKKNVVLKHEPKVFTASGLGEQPKAVESLDEITAQDVADIRAVTDETAKEYLKYFKIMVDFKSYNGIEGIVDIHENDSPEYTFAVAKKDAYGYLVIDVYYKYKISFTDDSYTYGIPVGDHWEGFNTVTDWEEVSSEYAIYLPIQYRSLRKDSNGKIVVSADSAKIYEHSYGEDLYYCWEKGTDPNDNYYSGHTPGYFMTQFNIYHETIEDVKDKALKEKEARIVE